MSALALLLTLVTWQVLVAGPLTRLDWPVHSWIRGHWPPSDARVVLTGFAISGQRWLITPLVAIAAGLAAMRARRIRPVIVAAATLGALWLGAAILKTWTGRVAPASGVDAVHAGGASFPSGHAAGAMVGYGLIVALSGSGRLRGWAPWQVSALAGGVVGVVVIVLDYHWVTDTLGAWLLSALVLELPALWLGGANRLQGADGQAAAYLEATAPAGSTADSRPRSGEA